MLFLPGLCDLSLLCRASELGQITAHHQAAYPGLQAAGWDIPQAAQLATQLQQARVTRQLLAQAQQLVKQTENTCERRTENLVQEDGTRNTIRRYR